MKTFANAMVMLSAVAAIVAVASIPLLTKPKNVVAAEIPNELLIPPQPTVRWGQDLLDEAYRLPRKKDDVRPAKVHIVYVQLHPDGPSYEFGLRSDGVVVWREVK